MDTLKDKIKHAKKVHREKREHRLHGRFKGTYILDLVFGANDGIITTFAIVAGVAGARLSPNIVLILGFANIFADGISMAIGNYLGRRSENDYFRTQKKIEEWEIEHIPQLEKEEVIKIYRRKGFKGKALQKIVEATIKDKKLWVELMLQEEHNIVLDNNFNPIKHGLATFFAFVLAGLIPLLAYILPLGNNIFLAAIVLTALALFGVGVARTIITKKNWWLSGLEILGVGSIAAGTAYLVGVLAEKLV